MRFCTSWMMRCLLTLSVVLGFVLCVEPAMAQTSLAVRVQWDPNPASDGVLLYTLVVDGGAPLSVPLGACSASLCEQGVTVSPGSHTFSLTATNQWGTSAPTGVTATITPPSPPKNIRIVK